ncbi:MAG: hypothetical protein B6243_05475 [Anaerolineaceae bacterium 4572_5.2]|nr:MAG: hypothetical protein B6243_05475 [Anaerolineaceae bacterium 4572_5.2]
MPKDYTTQPFNQIRRKDRAVDDEAWIKDFLHRAPDGAMATVFDGQPFITSRNYAYDEAGRAIYLHGAKTGRFDANVKANPRACFSVSEMGRLLPAKTALEFGVEFSGVVVFGEVAIVEDEEKATHGLRLLLRKYFPHLRYGQDYSPVTPQELKRTAVYRIDIETWSGKQKKVEDDFPGAFFYGEK